MSLFKTLAGVLRHGEKTNTKDQTNKKVSQPKSAKPTPKKKKPSKYKAKIDQAEAQAKEIILEAKNQAYQLKSQAEKQVRSWQQEISEKKNKLAQQESEIKKRKAAAETQAKLLDQQQKELEQQRSELINKQQQVKLKLEEVAGLNRDQARTQLFQELNQRLRSDIESTIRSAREKAQEEAEQKAREILVDALKHGATDYVAEYTVSTVALPNEDSKGRIIGKDGRNIRAFEKATGVDVDLDETPGEVRISSFDPIRREVARVALSRLLADGRIQPTRIEDYVKKAKSELDKTAFEEGKNLCHQLGVYNLPKELVTMLGKFKYYYSSGQNLYAKTLEQVKIATAIAQEISANVDTVRLASLLHDIGRISTDDGDHIEAGVKLLKRFNLPESVIQAVAEHHLRDDHSSPEAVVVAIADDVSTFRPGASFQNFEDFVQRMKKLETTISEISAVEQVYVLQSGKEIRVIARPDETDDKGLQQLALEIKEKLREEITSPVQIGVSILRETRASAVAK